jgi:hypothetical protein
LRDVDLGLHAEALDDRLGELRASNRPDGHHASERRGDRSAFTGEPLDLACESSEEPSATRIAGVASGTGRIAHRILGLLPGLSPRVTDTARSALGLLAVLSPRIANATGGAFSLTALLAPLCAYTGGCAFGFGTGVTERSSDTLCGTLSLCPRVAVALADLLCRPVSVAPELLEAVPGLADGPPERRVVQFNARLKDADIERH